MQLSSPQFAETGFIPGRYAFAVADPVQQLKLADNLNPGLEWSEVPAGVGSFVLICHDPDAPSIGDDVNQAGRTIAADLPRTDFYHWLLWNIPASCRSIAAGQHSAQVSPHGKPGPAAGDGCQHGLNDYSQWFATDPAMQGHYYGYDGPCPPWNDALIHRYIFSLYALAESGLELGPETTATDLKQALAQATILATATLTGRYSLNPDLIRRHQR